MKTFLIALAIVATPFTAAAASAQTAPTAKVFYGDLNLGSTAGQAELKVRVTRAARTVCGDSYHADLSERAATAACYAAAIRGAMVQWPTVETQVASR